MAHPTGGNPGSSGPGTDRTEVQKRVFGLGGTFDTTEGSPDKDFSTTEAAYGGVLPATSVGTTELAAGAVTLAKTTLTFKTYVVAGQDNTSTADYTATGMASTSQVIGAVTLKDQATIAATVAGTITPGTNKITVAGGADLSAADTFILFICVSA